MWPGGSVKFDDAESHWQLMHYGRAPEPAFLVTPENIEKIGNGDIYKILPFFGGSLTYGMQIIII